MLKRLCGVVSVAALVGACLASAAGAQPIPSISLAPSVRDILSGAPVRLSGMVSGASGATQVEISEIAYPYPDSRPVASVAVGPTGTFSLTVHPDRSAQYVASLPGTRADATATVGVIGRALLKVSPISLGRAMVTVLVFHPAGLPWNGVRVRWRFASPPGSPLISTPPTLSRALGGHITVLRSVVALPAGRFRWQVCFRPPGAQALLDPQTVAGCQGRGYHGHGLLPSGFPSAGAIARAASYLAARQGRTAFAVVDSEGRMSGVNIHSTFFTASVVKAMLLVAYLRRLNAIGQRTIDAYSSSFLYPMIHVSDNNAATTCWSIVGDSGLYQVAAAARMTDFSVSGLWGTALLSPADQARFFFEMDSLIPHEFVGYARFLLSTIIGWQSFGIPVIARPLGYRVFFKDGSEPTGTGQLVLQVARLEGHQRVFSIAIMTDGDPTMQYGIDTLQGVTQALLG